MHLYIYTYICKKVLQIIHHTYLYPIGDTINILWYAFYCAVFDNNYGAKSVLNYVSTYVYYEIDNNNKQKNVLKDLQNLFKDFGLNTTTFYHDLYLINKDNTNKEKLDKRNKHYKHLLYIFEEEKEEKEKDLIDSSQPKFKKKAINKKNNIFIEKYMLYKYDENRIINNDIDNDIQHYQTKKNELLLVLIINLLLLHR